MLKRLSTAVVILSMATFGVGQAKAASDPSIWEELLCLVEAMVDGCCDTDAANDSKVFGKVFSCTDPPCTFNDIEIQRDVCQKGFAKQWYCEAGGVGGPTMTPCSYKCPDNVCIDPPEHECIDSDEEAEVPQQTRGYVQTFYYGISKPKVFDACVPSDKNPELLLISEQRCSADHTVMILPTLGPCPNQTLCHENIEGAACVPATYKCHDEENGLVVEIFAENEWVKDVEFTNKCYPKLAEMTNPFVAFLWQQLLEVKNPEMVGKEERIVLDMSCQDVDQDGIDDLPNPMPTFELCPQGMTCVEGMCEGTTTPQIDLNCTDSEAEAFAAGDANTLYDPTYVGEVTITMGNNTLPPMPDICADDQDPDNQNLIDYACDAQNVNFVEKIIDCATLGLVCQEGSCISPCATKSTDIHALYGPPSNAETLVPPNAPYDVNSYIANKRAWVQDLNGDQQLDLVWGFHADMSVWYGAQNNTLFSQSTAQPFFPPVPDPAAVIFLKFLWPPGANNDLESIIQVSDPEAYSPVAKGDYIWSDADPQGTFTQFDPENGVALYSGRMIADLDDNGVPDIVGYYENKATNTWALRVYFGNGGLPIVPSAETVEPDATIITTFPYLTNPEKWFPLRIRTGHFTNPTYKDILIMFKTTNVPNSEACQMPDATAIALIANDASKHFQNPTITSVSAPGGSHGIVNAAVGDLNHDGLDDVILHTEPCNGSDGQAENQLYLWLSNPTTGTNFAAATPQTRSLDVTQPIGTAAQIADLNNDGWNDIAIPIQGIHANGACCTIAIATLMADNAAGNFANTELQKFVVTDGGSEMGLWSSKEYGLMTEDINADGCPDLLIQNKSWFVLDPEPYPSPAGRLTIFRSR